MCPRSDGGLRQGHPASLGFKEDSRKEKGPKECEERLQVNQEKNILGSINNLSCFINSNLSQGFLAFLFSIWILFILLTSMKNKTQACIESPGKMCPRF